MRKIEPGDPMTQSADVKAENIDRLKELFPELVTEGPQGTAINVDVLKSLVGDATVTDADEKYGLNWHGKRLARQIALTPSTGTLRPCPDESVDWDTTRNLMIEGDNLEVLKLLQKSYAGKVKMIYIDPPYNTGKDFVYPDNFRDNIRNYLELTGQTDGEGRRVTSNTEASGRFHTDWLNMMYPRLRLARNLLRDDGVIFLSVDDGEVANLRKACDEVFGEENFVANVVWQKKYTRSNDAKWFSDNHDHILCYAKRKEGFLICPLRGSNTSSYKFGNGVVWAPPTGTFRRFNDEAMARMEAGNEIWYGEDGTQTPQRKSFLSKVKDGVTPITIWPYSEVGHNHEANNELKKLGLGGVFNNPKPTRLINRMCVLSDAEEKDGMILDFFSGSGTAAHSVMDQNASDGGRRRFILVQLSEQCEEKSQAFKEGYFTIAEITKERLRRAGKTVHSIGLGALMVCLAEEIKRAEVESLADGILAWWRELEPAVPVQFVFRDSGFVDDVAKTNLAAILEQNIPSDQLAGIRSL